MLKLLKQTSFFQIFIVFLIITSSKFSDKYWSQNLNRDEVLNTSWIENTTKTWPMAPKDTVTLNKRYSQVTIKVETELNNVKWNYNVADLYEIHSETDQMMWVWCITSLGDSSKHA